MTAPSWDRAACTDGDPERWFPGPNTPQRDIAVVVAVCVGCPVRGDCLAFAVEHDERYGIWGGLTAEARRALVRDGAAVDDTAAGAA